MGKGLWVAEHAAPGSPYLACSVSSHRLLATPRSAERIRLQQGVRPRLPPPVAPL